jgi:uncharacterized membrane protein
MKAILATWSALIAVLAFIVIWMVINSHIAARGHHLDPYPWILLNLCLSCFAALQCFVLLIANKRGEQIAADIAHHTLENTEGLTRLVNENTDLTEQVKDIAERARANTERLDEIHRHLEAIGDRLSVTAGTFAAGEAPRGEPAS